MSLPGSSGGLPGPDFHRLVVQPLLGGTAVEQLPWSIVTWPLVIAHIPWRPPALPELAGRPGQGQTSTTPS